LTNEELIEQNRELKDQVAILTQQLDYLKRQIFGRKSEQLDHPDLFAGSEPGKPDSSGDADAPEEETESTESAKPKTEKRRRKIREARIPKNTPERIVEIVPEIVQANPEAWRACGFEEKTQLEKEPGYFYLLRIRRMKFVLVENPLSPPVIEPAKPTMIDGGFWGAGLLAEVLANKYLYHLPFDRQHVLNKQRYGMDLSPNTMGDAAA
jgi:transposase